MFVAMRGISVGLKHCTGECGNNGHWVGSRVLTVALCPCTCTSVFLLLDAIGLSFTNFSYLQQVCITCVSMMQNLHHVFAWQ